MILRCFNYSCCFPPFVLPIHSCANMLCKSQPYDDKTTKSKTIIWIFPFCFRTAMMRLIAKCFRVWTHGSGIVSWISHRFAWKFLNHFSWQVPERVFGTLKPSDLSPYSTKTQKGAILDQKVHGFLKTPMCHIAPIWRIFWGGGEAACSCLHSHFQDRDNTPMN